MPAGAPIAPHIDYTDLTKKLRLRPGFTAPALLSHEDLEARALAGEYLHADGGHVGSNAEVPSDR